ncbi:MAG: 6-carboxytetrahydropterin synthase [Candidatus Zixiibacteriota bacterium]
MRERYTAIVSGEFSAAHFIPDYKGNCCNLHGHNWKVIAAISKEELDQLGLSVDLRIAKDHLRKTLKLLDHTNLNDNPFLNNVPPTAENIASFIYDQLADKFGSARILYIDIYEGPNSAIRYERFE